jgi:uncharacterized protein (TIGR01777 family)
MPTVTITGGTGLIGKALGQALVEKGYQVINLSRKKNGQAVTNEGQTKLSSQIQLANWDIDKKEIDNSAISNADYIIHLAGANVAEERWTAERKKEIEESRVKSGEFICESLKTIPNRVKAVISASAIGWYGPDKTIGHPFIESDAAAHDFLGSTCEKWEKSIQPVTSLGKRLVILRTGIVLSKNGGALKEFIKPLKAGLATILGNGKQIISWIHMNDLVNLYIAAIENENFNGVYNAVASNPVSNKELVHALATKRNKFFIPLKVPAFVLKTMLGEMSIEILKSATVSNEKVKQAGFVFEVERVEDAVGE